MNRYLLNAAYIGTKYNGVTKNVNIKGNYSIEDALSQALAKLIKTDDAKIHISSRTDAGVHATNTTFAIDLNRNIPPYVITKKLNATFQAWHEQIRILKTTPVSTEFDVRRDAMCRTYLYRFAVCRETIPQGVKRHVYKSSMFIPIEESFRCYFVLNHGFDIERVKQAAKQMEGVHDFRSFMKTSKEKRTIAPRFCLRKMDSIQVRPGTSLVTSVNYEKTMANFEFWNVEFKSRAYFYQQIRNMVGTMIAAGNGRINQRDIYEMLTIPSKHVFSIFPIESAPINGLYLSNVEYSAEHLANCIRTAVKPPSNEISTNEESNDYDDQQSNIYDDEVRL